MRLVFALLLVAALAIPSFSYAGASGPANASFHAIPVERSESASGGILGSDEAGVDLPVSLLDPSRLSISHSLSYTYASRGGRSLSQGLFVTSFGYRIGNPLSMRLDLGASLDSASLKEGRGGEVFLKGLALDYRPSDSFRLQVNYRQIPRTVAYGARELWLGE